MQLVTVICLCHNHQAYVREALTSVLNQTHSGIQLIVVDDASTDGSKEVIQNFVNQHPDIEYLNLSENVGSCKAFNLALRKAKGAFIIDLAADDVLLPDRIQEGLTCFGKAGNTYGLQFSDAHMIGPAGNTLSLHSDRFPHENGDPMAETPQKTKHMNGLMAEPGDVSNEFSTTRNHNRAASRNHTSSATPEDDISKTGNNPFVTQKTQKSENIVDPFVTTKGRGRQSIAAHGDEGFRTHGEPKRSARRSTVATPKEQAPDEWE